MTLRLLFHNLNNSPIYLLLSCIWISYLAGGNGALAQQNTLDAVIQKIIATPASGHHLRIQPSASQSYLVQLKPGSRKENLINQGISIQRTLNQELFIIQATKPELANLLFEKIAPVNHLWKLSDELLLLNGSKHQKAHYTLKVKGVTVRNTIAALPEVEITASTKQILTIFASLETIIDAILPLEDVLYVGIESTTPQPESPVLDLNLHPNGVNRIHHAFPHLKGQGMTISIQELLYQTDDIDLQGRHIPSGMGANEVSKHATEMATIAAGAGNSFITGKGAAPGAGITSSAFDDLLPDEDEAYASLNAWVQNHSYGTAIENFYGTRAEAFDISANHNQALLHVFSSGNEGYAASPSGSYQGITGFANITGNFKMSKNTLSVGAVDTVGRPMGFSSRGPAHDGRIKPEVVAYSTAGSSNAAALVSGITALLQQAYVEQQAQLPPSALLKSLLINSASDTGPAGIDYMTGYGNVDGYRTLRNLAEKHYLTGNVRQGENKRYSLKIPADACNLKITVVWNDPAASPNANLALVNDLDMQLTDSQGKIWLPWVLDPSADISKLNKQAIRAADHLNNVEQITIHSLAAGTYTIAVNGYDVSSGPQQFYIAYQWDTLRTFEWASPTGSDNMPYNGETDSYFMWESSLSDTLGRLEYTTDKGNTWHIIADNIYLPQGNYRWQVPPITAVAQARMVVGADSYITDHFTISHPLSLTIGYNCADSLLIQWPFSEAATQYELSVFEGDTMKPLFITSDTLIVLRKDQFPSGFFSIQPIMKENRRGIRAPVFDYSTLQSSCFLVAFHAEVTEEAGIELITQLGTTYGVARIIFEREKNGVFEPIGSVRPQSSQVKLMDSRPQQGLNLHRSRVVLDNGKEIISETARSYFLTQTPFIVFPNPVHSAGKLQVFSRKFTDQEVIFSLYRTDGIAILSTKLLSNRESVSLPALSPGLYLYSIQAGKEYFSGKLIIH